VIVGVAELCRRFIAQPHEIAEIVFHDGADLLAGLPDLPSLSRVLRFLQHAANFAVGVFLVADLGAEDVECLFDRVRAGRHPLQECWIDLLLEVL